MCGLASKWPNLLMQRISYLVSLLACSLAAEGDKGKCLGFTGCALIRRTNRFGMLGCSVTHTIMRVPELDRMVVATRSEDNRVGIHSRRTKINETQNKAMYSHAHTLFPRTWRGN